MSARQNFLLVIVDHDRHIFNVVGPMDNDNSWNYRVVQCQKDGRRVNCFTASEGSTKESIVIKYSQQMDYEYVEDSVLNWYY